MAGPPVRERQRVGAVPGGEKTIIGYTPGREAVTYDPSGLWITIAILVVLFAAFFGWVLLLR